MLFPLCLFCAFFKGFIYLFLRERGRQGEREGEKHQCVVASQGPTTGDLAHNPGMCPDWESNWQPFGSQACTQSTELHQLGLWVLILACPLFFLPTPFVEFTCAFSSVNDLPLHSIFLLPLCLFLCHSSCLIFSVTPFKLLEKHRAVYWMPLNV